MQDLAAALSDLASLLRRSIRDLKPREPNYLAKIWTIDDALWLLEDGRKALAGTLCLADSPFTDVQALEEGLAGDPDRSEFLELARRCQQVMRAIPPYLLPPPPR